MSRTCCLLGVLALLPTPSLAQEPLADGITVFLGGGPTVAWFEKDGSIWRTDGTVAGTRDTGVPAGSYSVPSDRLTVYRQNAIHWISADGNATVLTPPFAFDGFDDDATEPTIWRQILATNSEYWVEIARRGVNGWQTEVRGVRGGFDRGPSICDVRQRPGRLLVLWLPQRAQLLTDLLAPVASGQWNITDIGAISGNPFPWTGGISYHSYFLGPHVHAFVTVHDRGPVETSYLPANWEGGPVEFTPGFPVARSYSHVGPDTWVAYLTSNPAPFDPPPGSITGLLWTQPGQELLALVQQAGQGQVMWLDRSTGTWSSAAGFGPSTAIAYVGDFADKTHLAVTDSSGTALLRYDESTHSATPLVSALASVSLGLAPFAQGFLFAANDAVRGSELWMSDGTSQGTRLLADLRAGPQGSGPRQFVTMGDRMLFVADSPSGLQVWSLEPQHLQWTRNPSNGRYYRLTGPQPWLAARTDAQNLGGRLATIRNSAEQLWLTSVFGPQDLWVGLSDLDGDGTFAWDSGEPLAFTNWCPGQPDRQPGESVVHITNSPGYCVGGWNDQFPSAVYRGVVERSEPPRAVEVIGNGCVPRPGQPPALARWTGGWPRPGGQVELAFNLGVGDYVPFGMMLLSTDSTAMAGMPLPIDLAPIGAPGCSLYVRPDDVLGTWGGYPGAPWDWTLRATLSIPNTISLRGAVVFIQALAYDHRMSSVRSTNALRIMVGG